MKKRLTAAVLMFALFLTTSYAATTYNKSIEVEYGINLLIHGKTPTLTDAKGSPVQPFVYNGTTYVPIRAVGENLGVTVSYNNETNTAIIMQYSQNNDSSSNTNITIEDIQILNTYKQIQDISDTFTSISSSCSGISLAITYGYMDNSSLQSTMKSTLSDLNAGISSLKPYTSKLKSAMSQERYTKIENAISLLENCSQLCNNLLSIVDKRISNPKDQTQVNNLMSICTQLNNQAISVRNAAQDSYNDWYLSLAS